MQRTSHRSRLASFLLMMFLAAGMLASAQTSTPVPNSCCTFQVVVSNSIPVSCLPVSFTTSWGGVAQTNVRTTVGIPPTTYTINSCPPIPSTFDWVSLDGGITRITLFNDWDGPHTLPCGTCVRVRSSYSGGCIFIMISAC